MGIISFSKEGNLLVNVRAFDTATASVGGMSVGHGQPWSTGADPRFHGNRSGVNQGQGHLTRILPVARNRRKEEARVNVRSIPIMPSEEGKPEIGTLSRIKGKRVKKEKND